MRSPARFGWGILGTGHMAAVMAPVLAQEGGHVVAVASRDPSRGAAFAEARGIPMAGHRAALLSRPEVDIVYIATPVASHHADCLAALAAGKHVLCEKPLAATAAQARDIAAAAAAAGRFCMEALWTHCLPAVVEAARLIGEGAIGTPLHLQASFGRPAPPLLHAPSGGVLLDRGCYPISIALRLLGDVATVAGHVRRDTANTDIGAVLLLGFAGGATASIGASFEACLANDVAISGTKGRLSLTEPITRPVLLATTIAATGTTPPGRPLPRRLGRRFPMLPAILRLRRLRALPTRGDGYGHQIEEVHRCLRAGLGESPAVPLALSIATLDVIDRGRMLPAAGLVAVDGFEPPTKGL